MKNNIFTGFYTLLAMIFFFAAIWLLFTDPQRATPCSVLALTCIYVAELEKKDK